MKAKYHHFMHSCSLWGVIFQQHNEAHPNTHLHILLVITFSHGNTERGFSTINHILTTAYVTLGKLHVDSLMMIRINVPILPSLSPNYEKILVQKTTNIYLGKKRYHTKPKSVQKQFLNQVYLLQKIYFYRK